MLDEASLLDSYDRQILTVMHEFEYDPFRARYSGAPHRISPVPLYLLYAATIPLSKQRFDGQSRPMIGPDVHSRVEAMKTLGLVRDGDRNWPEFSIRTMRDGRFIEVDSELGDRTRPSKSRPAHTIARCLYREYHVCFGWLSDLHAALDEAGYSQPGANHLHIMESVLPTFRHLSWCYYDEASRKKWCKETRIPYREDVPRFGLCYALTPRGITVARAASKQTSDPPGTPMSDDRYDWARQAELVRAVNQVLAEGKLDKGVLSRACKDGHVETNGKPGRGSQVRITSFLAWITRKFEIAKEEQTQVRNAIIGEITARNS